MVSPPTKRNSWTRVHRWCIRNTDEPNADLKELQIRISQCGVVGSPSPLHLASTGRNIEIISYLILKGADVNARDTQGGTPLHWACSHGNMNIIKLLIKKGANMNLIDDGM